MSAREDERKKETRYARTGQHVSAMCAPPPIAIPQRQRWLSYQIIPHHKGPPYSHCAAARGPAKLVLRCGRLAWVCLTTRQLSDEHHNMPHHNKAWAGPGTQPTQCVTHLECPSAQHQGRGHNEHHSPGVPLGGLERRRRAVLHGDGRAVCGCHGSLSTAALAWRCCVALTPWIYSRRT